MTETVNNIAVARELIHAARAAGKCVGLVPTMGALHEGHLSLIRAAAAETRFVVVSVFVNPAQFGAGEDFERYPRMPERDVALAAGAGADLIFVPSADEMYPTGYATYVVQAALTEKLCGVARPTHFHGVCTVVAKLFNIVQPDVAFFGQKDYQQCVVIQRMAADLNMPVAVRVCPTVREADGLAKSSRNQYLSAEERKQAASLFRALEAARALAAAGERSAEKLIKAMRAEIAGAGLARIEYLTIADPHTLEDLREVGGRAVAAVAVRFPSARLIDNVFLLAPPSES